ncbi:phosphotransferase IIA-like nitrogen-regulatory protein PtsN [Tepidamorphus gemmatus]|uniref:Phosphotransferase IIA-like nitrogen-regulatory protein PtsN n=1 Tax=Tepidamorphus gemmatus TaxID=747076 RepID=A0A4R3MEG7_9HYPH|nr:PTS IIA-like nitrogen regulatory protein PtsN [Tepidamorphus gemmatus]TCT10699.1 phosphotransferase IIA-like nitrogen-regulatory protein PtsN [Tepidamorphus gemmatus]
MDLSDLIRQDAIVPSLKASSKKQVIQELAERAGALLNLPARDIFDHLLQRERLGSTGIGQGVAIPHAKIGKIGSLFGMFARLDKPIDFDAIDDEPVDLVFLLLAPESAGADHLKALARIARLMREPGMAQKLRASRDAAAIYAVLSRAAEPNAA